ncbi:MAG: hypothetical protein BGO33_03155 [Bacteroidia bacterium 43-41]|nr:MAG: hypothetical protein BGO33_03155 [Bacteroidia bacterium 43-41]
MIDLDKLTAELNSKSGIYFDDFFNIKEVRKTSRMITYRNEGTSLALNRFDTPQEKVKVLKWFDDYWIFLELRGISNINETIKKLENHINISLCVFQGETSDEDKYQLFRAEWDDFCNPDEIHSQPHWHITSSQALEKTFVSYAIGFDKKDFVDLLENEKQRVFDVKKIHFAMNGNWSNSETNIHKIDSEEKVLKWWFGILNHIRTELDK